MLNRMTARREFLKRVGLGVGALSTEPSGSAAGIDAESGPSAGHGPVVRERPRTTQRL